MSEEKQVKDDDSVELGTVLQLSPHTPTNKVDIITRGKGGEEYVSLDDVFTVTGQEAFQVLAANCREYLKNKRLAPSGFAALKISGCEGLVPGYDRFNTVKGGESFIEALKKGFLIVIKSVKKFCLAVIDWIMLRIRTLLGFEKTEKELAIQAEISESLKTELAVLLGHIGNVEGVKIDSEELYAALPGVYTDKEAFTIISNGAKSTVEQLENMLGAQGELEKAEKIILASGNAARLSRSRYQQANRKLAAAFKDKNTFSQADILEYRHALDKEVLEELDTTAMVDMVKGLVERVWGIDLGGIGVDKEFKDTINKNRDKLNQLQSVKVPAEVYEDYRKFSKNFARIMLSATRVTYDANQLAQLKDLIEIKDAELIQAIEAFMPSSGVLVPTYSAYAGVISQYVSTLEHLINIVGQVRRSVAGVVNWANKVDKLMIAYISKDLKTMISAQEETLPADAIARVTEYDKDGNVIGINMDVDYDALFIAKHPKFAAAINTYRGKTGEFRKKYARPINTINAELKKLGVSQGI